MCLVGMDSSRTDGFPANTIFCKLGTLSLSVQGKESSAIAEPCAGALCKLQTEFPAQNWMNVVRLRTDSLWSGAAICLSADLSFLETFVLEEKPMEPISNHIQYGYGPQFLRREKK